MWRNDLALTPSEFGLLSVLVRGAGRALSRDHLLQAVAGREAEAFDRSIDVLVGRLRRKIEADLKNPRLIVTVPGVGYRFAERPAAGGDDWAACSGVGSGAGPALDRRAAVPPISAATRSRRTSPTASLKTSPRHCRVCARYS